MADFNHVKRGIISSFDEYLKGLVHENRLKNPEDYKQFPKTLLDLDCFLTNEFEKYCHQLSEEERRKQREGDIIEWFKKFEEIYEGHFKEKPKFIENAIALLNQDYWIIIDEYIRPFISKEDHEEPRVNFYKIISCTELAIMFRLPVDHEDIDQRVFLNAILALMTGKHLLSVLNECGPVSFSNTVAEEEHFKWLQMVYTDPTFPYFLNAFTWMYFDTILHLQNTLNSV